MFGRVRKCFLEILTIMINAYNHADCVSLNNQPLIHSKITLLSANG